MNISKEYIREQLVTNNLWLLRGILALYSKQTLDEQWEACTKHHNGVGFSGPDAGFLSSLAIQVLRKVKNGMIPQNALSEKQLSVARKLMPKYAGQLFRMAQQRLQAA